MPTMSFSDYLVDRGLDKDVQIAEILGTYLTSLPLASLREAAGVTQSEMGRRLKKSQAAVSKFEGRSDFLMSTFASYLKELGGSIDVKVSVAGQEFELSPVWAQDDVSFSLEKKSAAECRRVRDILRSRRDTRTEMRAGAVLVDWADAWKRASVGSLRVGEEFLHNLAANDEPQSRAA